MIAALAFAASAGMVAAFNPCGFALLPGYLALFLGSPPSRDSTVRRALLVGGAVTAGFVAVFGALGVAVAALSFSLGPWLSVVTLSAGGVLLVVGLLLLAGRDLSVRIPRATLRVNGSGPGMVAYGIVYATVSLSCTLPVFLAAVVFVSSAPGASPLTSAVSGLSYAAGMGLVMTSIALAAGVIGHGVTARARSWTRHVGRVSGGVVLLAALYVLWYAWVELESNRGHQVAAGPVVWVADASARISQAIIDTGTGRTALTLAAVVVGASITTAFVTHGRRQRARRAPAHPPTRADAAITAARTTSGDLALSTKPPSCASKGDRQMSQNATTPPDAQREPPTPVEGALARPSDRPRRPRLLMFDVNETLSDMSGLATTFGEVGVPPGLAATWFASLLRDGFALTVTGANPDFAPLASQSLAAMVGAQGVADVKGAVEQIMGAFSTLPLHPDVVEGVQALAAAGLRLVTLSNGSTSVAQGLFERNGIKASFEQLLSVQDAPVWKPAAAAYQYALRTCGVQADEAMLVAVHPWDIHGAHDAGLSTAFVNRSGATYPEFFARPDIEVTSLHELAAILEVDPA